MQHPTLERHSSAWVAQVWIAFVLAFGTTGAGILWVPVDNWIRAFLWMGLVFTISSSFALAKTIRDNHEATKILSRITDAKTEKLLREYEMKTDPE